MGNYAHYTANVYNHCGLRFYHYYKRLKNFAMCLCMEISYKKHCQGNIKYNNFTTNLKKKRKIRNLMTLQHTCDTGMVRDYSAVKILLPILQCNM